MCVAQTTCSMCFFSPGTDVKKDMEGTAGLVVDGEKKEEELKRQHGLFSCEFIPFLQSSGCGTKYFLFVLLD